MRTEDFWAELNDDYYQAYPELWEEGDLYADGPKFVEILNGATDTFVRRLRPNEEIVDGAIVRAGRKIWEVGRIYSVRAEPWVEPTLGQIKLILIKPRFPVWAFEAVLIFESAEDSRVMEQARWGVRFSAFLQQVRRG